MSAVSGEAHANHLNHPALTLTLSVSAPDSDVIYKCSARINGHKMFESQSALKGPVSHSTISTICLEAESNPDSTRTIQETCIVFKLTVGVQGEEQKNYEDQFTLEPCRFTSDSLGRLDLSLGSLRYNLNVPKNFSNTQVTNDFEKTDVYSIAIQNFITHKQILEEQNEKYNLEFPKLGSK